MIDRDYRLDIIRVLAMISIFMCHLFQIYNFYKIAFWLNIGVQLFFIISALLSSNMTFTVPGQVSVYYKKRLKKLFLPLWIYVIVITIILFLIGWPQKTKSVVLYLLGLAAFSESGILGLAHLWFVSIILICYALVPAFILVQSQSRKKLFRIVALILIGIVVCFYKLGYGAYGVYISFFIGVFYWFGNKGHWNYSFKRAKSRFFVPVAIIICIRLMLDNNSDVSDLYFYDGFIIPITKCVIAMFIFIVLYSLDFRVLKNKKFILYLSNISYEFYIVHQFILLSVNRFIPCCSEEYIFGILLGGMISLVLTFFNAIALKKLVNFFLNCRPVKND